MRYDPLDLLHGTLAWIWIGLVCFAMPALVYSWLTGCAARDGYRGESLDAGVDAGDAQDEPYLDLRGPDPCYMPPQPCNVPPGGGGWTSPPPVPQ